MAEPDAPLLDRQPVGVFVGGLAGVINAAIVAGNVLGWLNLTGEQTPAILACVTVTAGFTIATLRQLVYCRDTVRRAGIDVP